MINRAAAQVNTILIAPTSIHDTIHRLTDRLGPHHLALGLADHLLSHHLTNHARNRSI